MTEEKKNKTIQVKMKDEIAKGAYANLMRATHTKDEFILDFVNFFPPEGHLTARVITSPSHMKRITHALLENLKRYEERFGAIESSEEPNPMVVVNPTRQ